MSARARLFLASRRLLARPWDVSASAGKTTTGLVGVPVVPDSVAALEAASNRVLALVAKHVPETAHYRRQVEAVYQGRLAACKAHPGSPEGVEAALGEGQVEELLLMAQDEERLIPKMGGACPCTPCLEQACPTACAPGSSSCVRANARVFHQQRRWTRLQTAVGLRPPVHAAFPPCVVIPCRL